eukprot:COSAG01_NODE_1359_length_10584_cov_133.767668_7_plen_84_part_00
MHARTSSMQQTAKLSLSSAELSLGKRLTCCSGTDRKQWQRAGAEGQTVERGTVEIRILVKKSCSERMKMRRNPSDKGCAGRND